MAEIDLNKFISSVIECFPDFKEHGKIPRVYEQALKDQGLEYKNGQIVEIKRDITDKIKTFEDACIELGDNHPYVRQYAAALEELGDNDRYYGSFTDIKAYLKLRIITAALNEGWTPTFSDDEYRYFPWFYIYSKSKYDELDEDEKKACHVVGRSHFNAVANGGVAFAYAVYASSYSYTVGGFRLAFKTRELAEYCGKQFFDIWANYLFG